MPYDPGRHHRRSIRLAGHDYAALGAYFVTICAARRGRPFGTIVNGVVVLSPIGRIIADGWPAIPHHHPGAAIDAFVVMPDHIHGIIWLGANPHPESADPTPVVGAQHAAPLRPPGDAPAPLRPPGDAPAPLRPPGDAPAPLHPLGDAPAPLRPLGDPPPPPQPGPPGGPANAGPRPFVSPGSLGAIIRAFKSATTRAANRLRGTPGATIWQRNYYEHIVHSQADLHRIRAYIAANPARWRP